MKTTTTQTRKHTRIVLFLLCSLSALALQAQGNFRPGYIITMQQDTVYGEIDLRTNRINAQRCRFRASANEEVREFKPFDILGYRFIEEGKFYVSKEVVVAPKTTAPVFLEYLLEGMRSLYYYENTKSLPIYFVQMDNQLVKIDAPHTEGRKAGEILKRDKERYRARLSAVFDDPKVRSELPNATYTRQSMIKLARDYHYATCTTGEDCVVFETSERQKTPVLWTFTPYAGVIQNFMRHKQGESNPNLSYIAGITVVLTNPRMSNAISFTADLSVSQYVGSYMTGKQAVRKDEDWKVVDTWASYSHTLVSGKMGVRFTYPKGSVRPFLGLGIDLSCIGTGDDDRVFDGSLFHCGYYVDAGINILLSKQKKYMLMLRVRYDALYNKGYTVGPVNRGLDGTVGFTF